MKNHDSERKLGDYGFYIMFFVANNNIFDIIISTVIY